MIRNLHLTIIDGAHRGLTSLAGRRRSSMLSRLGNPEGSEVTLDPDNPEGSEVTLPPDNPEGSEVTLDPDNPEGSEVTLDPDNPEGSEVTLDPDNPDAVLYAASLDGAHGCGCGHACGCDGERGGRRPTAQRPGTRPRDYSGFVIVKTASAVDDAVAQSLHELAQKHRLDGLQRLLELRFEAAEDGEPVAATTAAVAGRGDDGSGAEPPGDEPSTAGYCGKPTMPAQGPPAFVADGPLVSFPAIVLGGVTDRRRTVDTLKALEARATRSGFRPQSSLSSFWRVDVRPRAELAEELVERLGLLPEVDLAYRELAVADPLAEDQNYLEEAPVGIGLKRVRHQLQQALKANTLSTNPRPVTVCDLEQQWRVEHKAFAAVVADNVDPSAAPRTGEPLGLFFGANRDAAEEEDGYGHHGNAVLGQLVGGHRIEGAVADVARPVLASHYWSRELLDAQGAPSAFAGTNGHVAAAIVNSLAEPYRHNVLETEGRLEAGDVLLLEVQRGRYPTEVDALDFEAIRLASALGVVVVEAAGNGGYDLDAYVDPDTGRSFNRRASSFRDSGAIFVGAAYAALPHDRVSFSNHGSRVDCFAWGTGVTTCGYGNLDGDERNNLYTNTFSGTSSAAPVIAAAAVLVQWYHCGGDDRPIGVVEMRRLLSDPANGTRQGRGVAGHVGVMPDLHRLLRHRLALVPDVYLRRHPGDDGSRPGRDESISSSPDLVVTAENVAATAVAAYGEGPTSEQPAPGEAVDVGASCSLLVRARNRGLGDGEVEVHTYCCPATTLITPELWKQVSTVKVGVPAGDLLHVEVASTNVDPPAAVDGAEPAPLSFLAVAVPVAKSGYHPAADYLKPAEQVLPPGGAYFDWRRYRHFLRSPGVAWRNVHRVAVKADAKLVTLPFYIAGTPDMTRRFDFEVLQRLPAGGSLAVRLHRDVAAKLMQSQPSLRPAKEPVPDDDDRVVLPLPRRPRLPIERQTLDADRPEEAAFVVGTQGLATGHSLAIRQLWRGVEVGRITWYFETTTP